MDKYALIYKIKLQKNDINFYVIQKKGTGMFFFSYRYTLKKKFLPVHFKKSVLECYFFFSYQHTLKKVYWYIIFFFPTGTL
jgi:hypothetical protein